MNAKIAAKLNELGRMSKATQPHMQHVNHACTSRQTAIESDEESDG